MLLKLVHCPMKKLSIGISGWRNDTDNVENRDPRW